MGLQTFDAFKQIRNPNGSHELSAGELKALQQCLLGMLEDVNAFCRANGIKYCLTGGSALGAARHQGMIPWDDDIDLLMPRKDFDRFIRLFGEQEKYGVQVPGITPGYPLPFGRIRLKGTRVITRDDYCCEDKGAFIDIFIAENAPDNRVLRFLHGAGAMGLGFALSCRKFFRDRKALKELAENDRALNRAIRIKAVIGFFLSFLSVETWNRMTDRWHRMCRNEFGKMIVIPSGRGKYFGELFLRDRMCRYRETPFEGTLKPCMEGLEYYLTERYGSTWKTPPADTSERHVYMEPFDLGRQNTTERE